MADTRRLAAALAPFHAASKHLQATQARLSALLAAVTGEVAARTDNLERLPAAARFNPFAVALPLNPFVMPKFVDAANAAEAGAKARGRRSDNGSRVAPGAAARPGAGASAALSGLASAADGLRRTPDLPPSAAALTRAAATPRAEAGPAPARTAPTSAAAGKGSANACSVGELINAVLQGHTAPAAPPEAGRTLARTARSGAAAAAGAGKASASAQSVGALIDVVLQGTAPVARPEAGGTLARTARSGAAAVVDAAQASVSGRSVGELIGSLLQRHAAPRPTTNAQPTASTADVGVHLQSATETLHTLVAPLFLRAAPDAGAGAAKADAQRVSGRPPLLRAPSRLLGATAPDAQATTAPAANAKAWAAPVAPASGQPADGPADLAAGLDRLLREQAWLRGVDLT